MCVAQLDRALGYGPRGREFESSRARIGKGIPDGVPFCLLLLGEGEMKNEDVPRIPNEDEYMKWMLMPLVLGVVTFGAGAVMLLLAWTFDKRNMARVNYSRAALKSIMVTIILVTCMLGIIFLVYAIITLSSVF